MLKNNKLITNNKYMFSSIKAFLIIDNFSQKQILKNEYRKL
jgi:hypothetical protein